MTVASRLLVSRLGRLPPKSLIARLTLTSRPREKQRERWEQAPHDPPKCETASEKTNCEALAEILVLDRVS